MNVFFELLKFIFCLLFAWTAIFVLATWFTASIKTLHYTKQNNVLLRELCIENGLNVDSLISTTQNDTLNLKFDLKGE